jgi:hypothetical protein
MEKAIFNKTGMKQIINSDFKEFNKQTNCISYGNCISNTQYSSFIRPFNEIECNGFINEKGHLLRFDLKYFKNIPERLMNILKDEKRTESYILYEFCIYKHNKKDVIGYVLTDDNHNFITDYVSYDYGCNFCKRESAIEEAKKYICK